MATGIVKICEWRAEFRLKFSGKQLFCLTRGSGSGLVNLISGFKVKAHLI